MTNARTTFGLPIQCRGVGHVYAGSLDETPALSDVNIDLRAGSVVALTGPSGSGKSTLLYALAGLLRPTHGEIRVGEHDVTAMSERELLTMRRTGVAVLAQGPGANLLPYLSPIENVTFAYDAGPRKQPLDALALLDDVGVGARATAQVGTLSGGEQQRLAVATTLATQPSVLLVDEPTSQLDTNNRDRVIDLLLAANKRTGMTIVIVTHDPRVAERVDVEVQLRDGSVVGTPR
ncbi:MAG: lipoprotein-releasing system ATP-binding protein [Frankiales bacterium]|jgi:ABC-type lipoprotein export system ATPase subunit|nr:lipoprotein-releasing system ATP-binding protein [Frankiales bacterium]